MNNLIRFGCILGFAVLAACSPAQQKSAQETASSAPAQAQDAFLATTVKAKLAAIDVDSTTAVHVDAKGGRIVLSGEAKDAAQRRSYADAARSVSGVTNVTDNLTLNPKLRGARESLGDAGLAARVMGALTSQTGINAFSVKVSAHDGVVDLRGMARTQATKSTMLETARSVNGVRAVIDHLAIKSQTP